MQGDGAGRSHMQYRAAVGRMGKAGRSRGGPSAGPCLWSRRAARSLSCSHISDCDQWGHRVSLGLIHS